jgi:hypothetical protein
MEKELIEQEKVSRMEGKMKHGIKKEIELYLKT